MNRYFREYNQLVEQALKTPSKFPGETHHILPRSIHKKTPSTMPVNAPENLVFLSHREHLKAHWLLFKMYEGTEYAGSMAAAFVLMINVGKTPAQPTAEQYQAYEEARIAKGKAQSERQTGEGNPMFGRTGDKSPMFGKTHSDEVKAKLSASSSGEKNPMFGIAKEKHPRFGKPRAKGAGSPSRPVTNTETGEVWESLAECGRQLGISYTAIQKRIESKSFGGIWQYKEAS